MRPRVASPCSKLKILVGEWPGGDSDLSDDSGDTGGDSNRSDDSEDSGWEETESVLLGPIEEDDQWEEVDS